MTPPAKGKIDVAIAMAPGATMIDFAGPYEIFQDVHVMDRGPSMDEMKPFRLYTVGAATEVVEISAGMKVVPDYTFEDAPAPPSGPPIALLVRQSEPVEFLTLAVAV